MTPTKRISALLLALATLAGVMSITPPADATGNERARPFEVTVQITNLAPANGTSQTPVWVGVHDGNFDLYDRNVPISPELERLAEDGTIAPLFDSFAQSSDGVDAAVPGANGPIAPGETTSITFLVDAQRGQAQYFSYASMILPSNDAFIANGSPVAHEIFNQRGRFIPTSFVVAGSEVLDAGSEVNDEIPANTAFFGQTTPDTGVVEGGNIVLHPGFNAVETGGILADARFANGDFTAEGYETLKFEITAERVQRRVGARLTGNQEVPAVQTNARGAVRIDLQADGDIDFDIRANRLDDTLFGHIHLGAPGENGPVVATLFNGDITDRRGRVRLDGQLASGDLVGPLAGMTTLDLWQEILDGNAYVNIHSSDNPGGELRANL